MTQETMSAAAGPTRSQRSMQEEEGRSSSQSIRTSSETVSMRERSLNKFTNWIGRRKTDYTSDAGVTMHSTRQQQPPTYNTNARFSPQHGALPSVTESSYPSTENNTMRHLSFAQRSQSQFRKILYSGFWRIALIMFALVLLFGAQIRELYLPKEADATMDIVFCIVFVMLFVDMTMRVVAEDHYWSRPKCKGMCAFGAGSFLFWCDLFSCLTLLYDISWINRKNFNEQHLAIVVSDFGIPISGLDDYNRAEPFEFNPTLLVTICQTARVARFIRSSRAVKISAYVNWYFLVNLLNPLWWLSHCRRGRVNQKQQLQQRGDQPSTESNRGGFDSDGGSSKELNGRSMWTGLGLGVLAAVKANASANEKSGFSGLKARLMRFLGRSPFDTEDFRRQLAATRIQRAWRTVMYQRQFQDDTFSSEFLSADVAWKGRTSVSSAELGHRNSASATDKNGTSKDNIAVVDQTGLLRASTEANRDVKRRNESQVGSAMRELTGQRVAIGIIVALVLTVVFTYVEQDATRPSTMIVLHHQTSIEDFAEKSLRAARSSSIPDLFEYTLANGAVVPYDVMESGEDPEGLRARERLRITISDSNRTTVGVFSYREENRKEALVGLLSTIFILLVWFFGVTAFAGPVMVLVVIPIERMVRLLAMLMMDPLGYQSTSKYKRFVHEENEITRNTRWTKDILSGMETSFLMSTILRIGSLMKVGFGSAGVEIIRNNLETGQSKNMLILSSQGSTVSCIFLFCDIRNFTDATECLQEEVFVFTNRIAAVVHSNCHAYGGSANKNVGDAFLLSWLLDEDMSGGHESFSTHRNGEGFTAKSNQADKALLSVVRICMALYYDDYYIEAMTDSARQALLTKLEERDGPVVQMGFGLHAGRAVQGAVGSQRKIDATYVSEAVERAEFLESSTKKYGVKMLMSDSFHRLLHPGNRRRCRKVDQISIREDDDDDDNLEVGETMELFTFDMDIDSLWAENMKNTTRSDAGRESDNGSDAGSKRSGFSKVPKSKRRSMRIVMSARDDSDEMNPSGFMQPGGQALSQGDASGEGDSRKVAKLVLPTGPALYSANVWTSEEMRTIRQLYSDGLFFQKFTSGLQSFYSKDWDHARQCFAVILDRFEDGPSRYFMKQIEQHKGKPPRDFLPYGSS